MSYYSEETDFQNLLKDPTFYQNPNNPNYINLIIFAIKKYQKHASDTNK